LGDPGVHELEYILRKQFVRICTGWSRMQFQKLIVSWLIKKFSEFMEPLSSLWCSQEPATGPYSGPDEATSYTNSIKQNPA